MITKLLKNITLSIIPMLLVQCGTTDIPRYDRYNDIFESKFFQKEWEVIFDYKNNDIQPQEFTLFDTSNKIPDVSTFKETKLPSSIEEYYKYINDVLNIEDKYKFDENSDYKWKMVSFRLEREEIEEYDKDKIEYRYICVVFTPSDNYLYCYVQHHLP